MPEISGGNGAVRRSRTRQRTQEFSEERRTQIVQRVLDFYNEDIIARSGETADRIQRYAKFRMWAGGKDWPWPNASDVPLPDMMEQSLRMQDSLHNALMSARPVITSKAVVEANRGRQDQIDHLIDFQIFEEQDGETSLGNIIDSFVNDGVFTAFIPWVKERREVNEVRISEPMPDDAQPLSHFSRILSQEFPNSVFVPKPGGDGWDWMLAAAEGEHDQFEAIEAHFYTDDENNIELVLEREIVVYDGPKLIHKEWQDVLHPVRCENLQPPGPSNPLGAGHVILIDTPTIEEVKNLAHSKFYDLVTPEDIDEMLVTSRDTTEEEVEQQKDDFAGKTEDGEPSREDARSLKTLTRLTCFDMFDIDNDGVAEDVVWWVILETRTLLRARILTEVYPSNPPRRPFGEAPFIPVPGRRGGIGLLEQIESLHDIMKQIIDQSIDNGTIKNAPFGFYRPQAGVNPGTIALMPGELYPLANPDKDIKFPDMGNSNEAFGFNMITLLRQMEERLTMQGDIQFGRVPPGRSSALRTVGGMSLLSQQGEARPERILRRFFIGLVQIWSFTHQLNKRYMPAKKVIRITGIKGKNDDVYSTVERSSIGGKFDFTFGANVFNATKTAMQQGIQAMMEMYISPMALQLGLIDADGAYRLFRDAGKALGQDPDQYIKPPTPESLLPRLLAEEILDIVISGHEPVAQPMEGAQPQMEKLIQFVEQDDRFGTFSEKQVDVLKEYMQRLSQRIAQEQKQQALIQAAAQLTGGGQQNPGGRPPENAPPDANQNPPISGGNELLDETLPSAGGGGSQAQ